MITIQNAKPININKSITVANNDRVSVILEANNKLKVEWTNPGNKTYTQDVEVAFTNASKILINDYDHCLVVMPSKLHSFKLFRSMLGGDVYSKELDLKTSILDCQICNDIILVRTANGVEILSLSLYERTRINIPNLQFAYLVNDKEVFMVYKTTDNEQIIHCSYPDLKIDSDLYKNIPSDALKYLNGIILNRDGKIYNTQFPSAKYQQVSNVVDFCIFENVCYILDSSNKITNIDLEKD
jgi:hypothetical protein